MALPLGYDELLQCPYEESHRIMAHSMAKHLYKCRKNHPGSYFVPCPFNVSHRVPVLELKIHTNQCEDRASFETYKYCITTEKPNTSSTEEPTLVYNNSPPKRPSDKRKNKKKKNKIVEQPQTKNADDEECWDDMKYPAYDPQKYCEKSKVIRKATLKKPSEKKDFYESERLRLQNLKLDD